MPGEDTVIGGPPTLGGLSFPRDVAERPGSQFEGASRPGTTATSAAGTRAN